MRAIVTGGAGFIGSHLAELLLKKGFKVKVIDNLVTGRIENLSKIKKKITFLKESIENYSKIEKHFKGCDYVFHLAGLADIVPSIEKPEKYYNTNVTGTLNVLRASKKYNIKKVVYAASASCYGMVKNFPTNESNKISTEYPYALTKFLGEELVAIGQKHIIFNYIAKTFNVYGIRSRTTGAYGAMFGVFLAQLLNKKPLTIVGDGKQTRDFTM